MYKEEIEKSLLEIDEEIHRLLQYVSRSKEKDVEAKLKDYENLKRMISGNVKEPLNPTEEIRKMREKQYSI
jgi:hypothetical protein